MSDDEASRTELNLFRAIRLRMDTRGRGVWIGSVNGHEDPSAEPQLILMSQSRTRGPRTELKLSRSIQLRTGHPWPGHTDRQCGRGRGPADRAEADPGDPVADGHPGARKYGWAV